MEKDTKHLIIMVAAAIIIIIAAFLCINLASGVNPPQTVVESSSMQHGTGSEVGTIDTGDMVLLIDKDRTEIRSYVDGYKTGYRAFGGYGDVIVYDRGPLANPVIHRAILWLEYNGDGTWSAPSLEGYPSDRWSCTSGDDYTKMTGILTMRYMKYDESVTATLNLDELVKLKSSGGFITMGDNNAGVDQLGGVPYVRDLIPYEQINSVAWIEIPWVGAFKMMWSGKGADLDKYVPNTIPCLAAFVLSVIFLLFGFSFLLDRIYYSQYRRELHKEMYAPAPSFLVEDDNE
ncbi:MAG: S26 family signal peptidase [Candidatus Methanoplasma sp.]|nr:S26 family signal peptidase [Candidatus Methanoplasma sp.]